MALDSNEKAGIAALAAVTVGGVAYYLAKRNEPGTAAVLQSVVDKKKGQVEVYEVEKKLTPGEKGFMDMRFASRVAISIPKPVIPTFKTVSGFSFEPRMNNGLLGKLVAAYWAYAQTRLWYMTRCKQYHPFDDTPQWLARDAAHGGHDMDKAHYKELMKTDRGTWPIGVPRSFIMNRWEGENPSKFNKYQRYNSLDQTFPNWSMPFGGFDSVFTQAGLKRGGASNLTRCWRRCGWRRTPGVSSPDCHVAGCSKPLPTRWFADIRKELDYPADRVAIQQTSHYYKFFEPFEVGKTFNGDMISNRLVTTRGYRYVDSNFEDDKSFAGIVEKKHYYVGIPILGGYPGRIWGKVSTADRLAARYVIKVPRDFVTRYSRSNIATVEDTLSVEKRFSREIYRYYVRGYNLVNTCLDILIDRKHVDLEKEFPEFVKHCNWWWILPPNKSMLANVKDKDGEIIRMARLSDIGGGNMGLGDISSKYLVDYVMRLTPKPGTIPPWEDKGPLWLWPSTTGQMSLMGAPTIPFQPEVGSFNISSNTFLRSAETSPWNSWNNMWEYALTSLNEAIYSYVVKEVGGEIGSYFTKTAATWAENLGIDVLEQLQGQLKGSWDTVMDLGTKIAAFAGIVDNIDLADKIAPYISKSFEGTALNTYDLIKKYLTDTVDGVSPAALNTTRRLLDAGMSEIREWGWGDDLIGELGALGSDFGNRGIKTLRSKYGYYK